MNYLKAIFAVLKKIDFIIDLLVEMLENWNEKEPTANATAKIKELQKLKKQGRNAPG